MRLVKAVYQLTSSFHKEEIYGLTRKMRRAAVSIPSNIAEGAARHGMITHNTFSRNTQNQEPYLYFDTNSLHPVPNPQSPVPNPQSPIPNTQSPIPNPQSPLPITQYPLPSTQSPVPSPQSPVPSTQYPVPSTQYPVPNPYILIPNPSVT